MPPAGFDPARPDGINRSRDAAISADGRPEYGRTYSITPRTGRAARIDAGDRLTVINPSGHQVCDFWAFRHPVLAEYLSMAHTHTALQSIFPKVGDILVSNARTPLLAMVEDTSPGVHDTVIAACDLARYRELGVMEYHDNCTDNLRMALAAIGLAAPAIPAPFNLWMNIPVSADGGTRWAAPVAAPGDHVSFDALENLVVVMSACPQDLTAVNGEGVSPSELAFRVHRP